MDTPEEQYAIQNYYFRFESMSENGESNWTKIMLNKMDFQLLHLRI